MRILDIIHKWITKLNGKFYTESHGTIIFSRSLIVFPFSPNPGICGMIFSDKNKRNFWRRSAGDSCNQKRIKMITRRQINESISNHRKSPQKRNDSSAGGAVHCRGQSGRPRGNPVRRRLQAGTPLPVSYTHLDVYKRQIRR